MKLHFFLCCSIVKSFIELAPKLLDGEGFQCILSEAFSQDPLEAFFSRQRHRGGSCDNPRVQEFYDNTAALVQQREVYRDLTTMNVQACNLPVPLAACMQPLPKRPRRHV